MISDAQQLEYLCFIKDGIETGFYLDGLVNLEHNKFKSKAKVLITNYAIDIEDLVEGSEEIVINNCLFGPYKYKKMLQDQDEFIFCIENN